MKIVYIASVRIPNEKASGLAIMRQCEAFSNTNINVVLLKPYRTNHITEDPFLYYGIEQKFEIQTMASIDFYLKLGIFGFALTRMSQMIFSFYYILKHKKTIDVIYSREPWMLILPIVFLKKISSVLEVHQAMNGRVISYVVKHVTQMICISQGLVNHYKKLTSRMDMLLEPSGVDLKQFEESIQVVDLKNIYHIPVTQKVIAYIGKYTTMGEGKGVEELIHAFVEVKKKNCDTHLLIVGLEPHEFNVVHSMCATLGLSVDDYTLLQLQHKKFAEYVQVSDILVMNYPDTEHYRNFMSPTKLFAYMGSKKIIVASDLTAIREIVDESMVFFSKPSDRASLVDVLERVLHTPLGVYVGMQQKALEKVQTYTWQNRARRIIDAIR